MSLFSTEQALEAHSKAVRPPPDLRVSGLDIVLMTLTALTKPLTAESESHAHNAVLNCSTIKERLTWMPSERHHGHRIELQEEWKT